MDWAGGVSDKALKMIKHFNKIKKALTVRNC